MNELLTPVITGLETFFSGVLSTFSSLGNIIFVTSEAGAMTLTPFAWVIATLMVVGIGTWLISKGFGLIGRLFRMGR